MRLESYQIPITRMKYMANYEAKTVGFPSAQPILPE